MRVTHTNGAKYFVSEFSENIILVKNIKEAFEYKTILEFKVSWALMKIIDDVIQDGVYIPYFERKIWDKKNIVKFECIDSYTLDTKSFNVYENEIEISREIYVDPRSFRRLMICGHGHASSHWLYDKNDNWIAFPEKEDYDRVFKIRYLYRGLSCTIKDFNNWSKRYDDTAWHSDYQPHHNLMHSPIMQQLALLDLDSCHEFEIYQKN